MDDMDIDRVVEIPDTPDRPAARHINSGDFGGNERKLSVVGCLRNSDFMDEECLNQPRARGRIVNENGHNQRLHRHHPENYNNFDKSEQCSNFISLPTEDNSYASQNASLFRRTTIDKNSKHETRDSIGAKHMDRGKQICSNSPSKSSAFREDHARVGFTEPNGCSQMLEMALPCGNSKNLPAKEIREGQTVANCSSSHWPPNFPMKSCSSSKGKGKIGYNTSNGVDSFFGHRKVVDVSGGSQHNNDKQMSASHHSLVSPTVNRQKRLVRNGCISPHNIEMKAKQLAEHSQNCSKDVDHNPSLDAVFSGPCTIDISDIVAEDNDRCTSKGIMMHPSTLKEREPKITNLSSGPPSNQGEVNRNGHAAGWRSRRNHSKKVDHLLPDSTVLQSGRNDDLDQINKSSRVATTVTKRQKKHESTSSNCGQSSKKTSHDSDIVFLGSSGESSRSRSSRIQSCQHQGILDIDDFSPEMSYCDSQGIDYSDNGDSDAIARQLEADEILALELQEQLYHESPVFGGAEIDENLARVLQQEEDALRFSNRNHHGLQSRTSSSLHRLPRPQRLQNASNRGGAQARVQNSAGIAQLRSRFLNRSRASPSRGRNFRFPLEMDLDMRLDILEALEAAVGDFDDMETVRHVSQVQREFNE